MIDVASVFLFWIGMFVLGAGIGVIIGTMAGTFKRYLVIPVLLCLCGSAVPASTSHRTHQKWEEQLIDVVRNWDPECGARPNRMVIDTVRKVVLAMKPEFRPWHVEACGESGIRVKYDIPRGKLAIIEIFNDGSVDIDWYTEEGWIRDYRIPNHDRLCELVNLTKVFLSL